MSADNGTYILQTYGPEFRVAHVQAIDNIYGDWNETTSSWSGDPKFILDIFGSSKVFTEIEEAWDAALAIDASVAYSEYGTCLIKEFQERKFSDFIEANTNGTAVGN
jgi:hypothetical protein